MQTIHDEPLDIFTDWINDGPVWTARVMTTSNVESNFALLFYFAIQVLFRDCLFENYLSYL